MNMLFFNTFHVEVKGKMLIVGMKLTSGDIGIDHVESRNIWK